MPTDIAIFWHRRDLRTFDNAGLFHALKSTYPVLPLFIFDNNILEDLEDRTDARVTFIHDQLLGLHEIYKQNHGSLLVKTGTPSEVFQQLLSTYRIKAVFTNDDYEPYARERDQKVRTVLATHDIPLHVYKDHVIFEKEEVVKKDGNPYTIYTPYMRAWKSRLENDPIRFFPSENHLDQLYAVEESLPIPSLEHLGFTRSALSFPSKEVAVGLIKQYDKQRDFPALSGTSRLGIHFRFGTISIRQKTKHAQALNATYLNELIWRDFYQMIIFHFPHSAIDSFKPAYDRIQWQNDEKLFECWCKGETGYPLVDAGMRELNNTGYMHNRVRMVVASFLSKHLLIDWRWGEAYFAAKLLDYELASNVGGWQWAAGCGCDAAPYFRVFNPLLQAEKFDPEKQYIKHWIPEYGTSSYAKPVVVHEEARKKAIETYKQALT